MGRIRELFCEDDLNSFGARVLKRVRAYEERNAKNQDTESLGRLLDFRNRHAAEVWRSINLFGRKKTSKGAEDDIVSFLVWIETDNFMWRFSDKRHSAAQLLAVKNIGIAAKDLMKQITTAPSGTVSTFLNQWAESEPKQLPLEAFTDTPEPKTSNFRAQMAWHQQKNFGSIGRFSIVVLLILLARLSRSARDFKPVSVSGKSRKKDRVVFFVIRLHIKIINVFGRTSNSLTSHLTSLVFNSEISQSRVKEILKRARLRGEIPA